MFYDKKIPINSNNNTFYTPEQNNIKEDTKSESIFEVQGNNVESLDETTFNSYMEIFSNNYVEENNEKQNTTNARQNIKNIDENEILIKQLEAEIAKLESKYNANEEGKGIAGSIGDIFSSCWNGITGKGFKNTNSVELDKKIALLKAAKSNPAILAETYKDIMGVELTDEVKQNAIEAQKVADSLSTEEKEAVADILKGQAASLSKLMEQTKDDQGWFSKTIDGINNVFGFGTNSIKADAQIEQYIKQVNSLDPNDPDFAAKYQAITGEALSIDGINELAQGVSKVGNSSAAEAIIDYEETQVSAKEIGSGIVTGAVTAICVIAGPFTGGTSLLLGAAVGGATTVLINGTDTIGTSKKYSFEQSILDIAGGAINGTVTAMTLGGAGIAGKGLSVLKGAGSASAKQAAKEMISGGFKNTVKTAFNGFGKAAWNGAKIAGISSTGNYLLNTVGTNTLYEATGNYSKSETPANIVQNEDGTYSIYYALTDSNTGNLISYEIETLDSLSQDKEGNLIKGNILDVTRSNNFDLGDFAEQTIVSMGSAALGAGIGKVTGNIINPYATSITNSVILGNTTEIATDMTLSLGADYLIECARRGEIVDKDEFFSWDRILGEGQNQIRGLLIGIASSKANPVATDSVRAGIDAKTNGETEIRLDGTSAPKTQQEVLESAGRLIIEENNPTKARELLTAYGMKEGDVARFFSEVDYVRQQTSQTCAVTSVLNAIKNKPMLAQALAHKFDYDENSGTIKFNICGEDFEVIVKPGDDYLQKAYEAYQITYGNTPDSAIRAFNDLLDGASDVIVRPNASNIEQLRQYAEDDTSVLTFNTADGLGGRLSENHAYTVLGIDEAGNIKLQDPTTLEEITISRSEYEGSDCQIEGKTYKDSGITQDGVEARMVAGNADKLGHSKYLEKLLFNGDDVKNNPEECDKLKAYLADIYKFTSGKLVNDKNIIIRDSEGYINLEATLKKVELLHKVASEMAKPYKLDNISNPTDDQIKESRACMASVGNFLKLVIGGDNNNPDIAERRLHIIDKLLKGYKGDIGNLLNISDVKVIDVIPSLLARGFDKNFIINTIATHPDSLIAIPNLHSLGIGKRFIKKNIEHLPIMLSRLNHVLKFDGFNSQGNFDGFHNLEAHAKMIAKADSDKIGATKSITDILKSYAKNPDEIQQAGIKKICENIYEVTVEFQGKKTSTIRYKKVEDPITGIMVLEAVNFYNPDNHGLHRSIISQVKNADGQEVAIDDVEAKYYFSAHPNAIKKVTASTIGESDMYVLTATKNDGSVETIMFEKFSTGVGDDSFEVFEISARDMEFCDWCKPELFNRIIRQAVVVSKDQSDNVTIEDFKEFFGKDYNPNDKIKIREKDGVYLLEIKRTNGTAEVIKFRKLVDGTMGPALRTPLEFTKGLIGKQKLTQVFQRFYSSDFAPSQDANAGISFNGKDYNFISYQGLNKLIVIQYYGQKYIFSFNGRDSRYVCNTFFPISEAYFNAMQSSISNGINVIELN